MKIQISVVMMFSESDTKKGFSLFTPIFIFVIDFILFLAAFFVAFSANSADNKCLHFIVCVLFSS